MDIILLVNKMYLSDFVECVSVLQMPLTEALELRRGTFKNGISSGKISGPATYLLCPVSSWTVAHCEIIYLWKAQMTLKNSSEIQES